MQGHRPKPKLIATCETIFTEISSNKPKCRQAISEILTNQIYFRQKLNNSNLNQKSYPAHRWLCKSTLVYTRCMKTLPLQRTYFAIG